MLFTEPLEHIIKLALYTPYLADERPVSLLVTAKVESGKTEMVLQFAGNEGIQVVTDITAWGIQRKFASVLQSRELKTIIFPDLITPLTKNRDTALAFTAFLNALIEEGIGTVKSYAVDLDLKVPLRCNIIACIARETLMGEDGPHIHWKKIGFMSRLVPLSYDYGIATITDILDDILKRGYHADSHIVLDFPPEPQTVDLPEELSRKLLPFAITFGQAEKIYGFRRQKHLQTLMMANALINKRDVCAEEDYQVVKELIRFINLDYTKV